jgi:hypothetical protein
MDAHKTDRLIALPRFPGKNPKAATFVRAKVAI